MVSAAALLDAHGPALRHFLGARCRDPQLTADLVQETALRLIAAEPRLDAEHNPRGYLFRIAANVWRDHLRRRLTEQRAAERLTRQPVPAAVAADQRLLSGELRAAVTRAVAALPAAQREVLELRHRGALSFRDIAERLDRPLGTVLSQMHAALEKVAAALEEYR